MPKDSLDYLRHIRDECLYIRSAVTPETLKANFIQDETLKRAVVRSLEIIGEATKKIPADIKFKWGTVEWKSMAGMRDRLIHDYMGVNYAIVWDVATNKIPTLLAQVEKIIQKEENE